MQTQATIAGATQEPSNKNSPEFKNYAASIFDDEPDYPFELDGLDAGIEEDENQFIGPNQFKQPQQRGQGEANDFLDHFNNINIVNADEALNSKPKEHPVAFLFKEAQINNYNIEIKEVKDVSADPILQEGYFDHIAWAIKRIADGLNVQEDIDLMKVIMGAEPARRGVAERPKTSHEERQDYNVYQLSLFILNVIANYHEEAFYISVIQKHKKRVEKSYDDLASSFHKKAGYHMQQIDTLGSRKVKIELSYDDLEKKAEYNNKLKNEIEQGIVRDKDYIKKAAENPIPPVIFDYLEELKKDAEKFQLKVLPYQAEKEKLDQVIKEWELAYAQHELEMKFIDDVRKMYVKVLKSHRNSIIKINYGISEEKIQALNDSYRKEMKTIVEKSGHWLAVRNKDVAGKDLPLWVLLESFARAMNFMRTDPVIIHDQYIENIKQSLSKFIKEEKLRIIEESILSEFTSVAELKDDTDNSELANEEAKKKLNIFFAGPLDKLEKDLFASKEWLTLTKEPDPIKEKRQGKDLNTLYKFIEDQTVQLHKHFMSAHNSALPLAEGEKDKIKKENNKKFNNFVENWRKKQLSSHPDLPQAVEIARRIRQLRDSDIPLAKITEKATGDTLLHIATRLYNDTQDYQRRVRLLKAIEILFIHGANAFATNNANEKAYDFISIVNKSMLDWHFTWCQLRNTDAQSQFKQKAISYLSKYCESNHNMFNQSYFYYAIKGFWVDQKVKLERMKVVWLILQEMEDSKYLASDVKLQQFVADTIGGAWKKGLSSALWTNLEELRLEGYKPTTLMLQNSQEVMSRHIQLENEELRKKLLEFQKSNSEKDKMIEEKENIIIRQDALIYEKDKAALEKDKIMAEKEKIAAEKEKIVAEKVKIEAEKDKIAADNEISLTKKDETIKLQKVALEQSIEALNEANKTNKELLAELRELRRERQQQSEQKKHNPNFF